MTSWILMAVLILPNGNLDTPAAMKPAYFSQADCANDAMVFNQLGMAIFYCESANRVKKAT